MDFMQVMKDRYAAKSFNEQKISKEDLMKIVEFGRLSPSSFGLEPWKFVVVSNQELKDKLVEACYNQEQVGQASEVIVILSNKKDFMKDSSFIADTFSKRMPEQVAEMVTPMAERMIFNMTDEQKILWAQKQCYIAAANMMTGAKSLGIDSCPMEGFVDDAVLSVLDIDFNDYAIALVIPFGYSNKEGYPKQRFDVEDIAEFRE